MIVSGAGSGAAIENIAPVMSMRVDGPGRLAQLEVLDEQRRHDVHGRRGYRRGATSATCIVDVTDVRRLNRAHLGRAGAGPRRLARLRRRTASPTDPAHISDVVALRPPAARRRRRAARRAPAVPHRHRHRVARPPRGPDDRPRLLGAAPSPRPAASPRRPAPTSSSSSPTCTTRRTSWPAARSTSCTPASGRSSGCPTSTAGPASSPTCCGPAVACSCARAIRSCGRSADPRPDGLLVLEHPYFERAEPTRVGRRRAPTSPPTSTFAHTRQRTSGTTGSARSSPPCSTTACELTMLVEHDSVPWDALPGQMEDDRRRRVPPDRPPRAPAAHATRSPPSSVE